MVRDFTRSESFLRSRMVSMRRLNTSVTSPPVSRATSTAVTTSTRSSDGMRRFRRSSESLKETPILFSLSTRPISCEMGCGISSTMTSMLWRMLRPALSELERIMSASTSCS